MKKKNNCGLFERLFKFKKNSIFLFGISSFDYRYCFLIVFVLANEESDSSLNKICWFDSLVGRALHWYMCISDVECSHLIQNWIFFSGYNFTTLVCVNCDDQLCHHIFFLSWNIWSLICSLVFLSTLWCMCISNTQCDQLSVGVIATQYTPKSTILPNFSYWYSKYV